MAQINLKQLEAFVQVVDLGSFRRAAEKLNTTQPNISSRIAALEAQLDLRLMERDAGSVRLTPVGEKLLARARDVLRSVDAFVGAAEDDSLFEGLLRIGVTEMIVHSWLGAFLTGLRRQLPNVDIDLTVDFSANLSAALINRSVDLTLQSAPFARQTSGMVELGSYPLSWVAAPELALHGRPVTLEEMARHPLLTHARGTLPFDRLRAHVAEVPGVSARLVPSTNMVACLQMTRDALGIACLPEVMVRPDIDAGALAVLDYAWVPDALVFFARYDATIAPEYVLRAAECARVVSARWQAGKDKKQQSVQSNLII